jgi:hypothetical protein
MYTGTYLKEYLNVHHPLSGGADGEREPFTAPLKMYSTYLVCHVGLKFRQEAVGIRWIEGLLDKTGLFIMWCSKLGSNGQAIAGPVRRPIKVVYSSYAGPVAYNRVEISWPDCHVVGSQKTYFRSNQQNHVDG